MKNTMFFVGALTFLFSYVSTFDLWNKTACFPHNLIIDTPCESTEMILPKKFILAKFSNKTCEGKISNNPHKDRDINVIKYCCQLRWNDILTEYCLPSEKSKMPYQPYRELIDSCTGRQTCSFNGNVKPGYDYVTMEYQCIPKIDVLEFLENSSITEKTVFLYNNQPLPPSDRHCMAYSLNCEAILTIRIVASNIPHNHCNVTYRENKFNQSTFSCSYFDQHGGCQPTYNSTSNFVDIHLNMGFGSQFFLWLEIQATRDNVTVACGEGIFSDVPRGCPTTTAGMNKTFETKSVTTTASSQIHPMSMIGNGTHTSQLNSVHLNAISSGLSTNAGQETSSHSTDVTKATVSSVSAIVGSSIGAIAVLLLIGLAFLCYHRRRSNTRSDSLKEESKMEVRPQPIINSDRPSVTCENHIYVNEDFQLKVRDVMAKGDDKVQRDDADYENIHIYSTLDGED